MSQTPRASQTSLDEDAFFSPGLHNGSSSPVPMQLTPRSKIKALLADSEDESDKENQIAHSKSSQLQKQNPSASTTLQHQQAWSDASSPDVESRNDLGKRLPRGRLAAQMQDQMDSTSNVETAPGQAENAYERVRKQLLAGSIAEESKQRTTSPTITDEAVEDVEDDEPTSMQATESPVLNEDAKESDDNDIDSPPRARTQPSTRLADLFSNEPSPTRSVRSRQSSPDLFVSPSGSATQTVTSADALNSNNTPQTKPKNRFQELIARKQKEWQDKEAAAAAEESEPQSDGQLANQKQNTMPKPSKKSTKSTRKQVLEVESEGDSDKEEGQKLTQQARPTRKASKRAQEEMKRETQRMSRNMQLTHEARTKKKFTTQDFLSKFNFRGSATKRHDNNQVMEKDSSSSAPVTSDAEPSHDIDTPPSSPPSVGGEAYKTSPAPVNPLTRVGESTIDMWEVFDAPKDVPQEQVPAPITTLPANVVSEQPTSRIASLRKFEKSLKRPATSSDSDDDLEIVGKDTAPSRLPVFDRIPEAKKRESTSIHTLRALAQIHDHERSSKKAVKSLNPSEMRVMLQRRARQQALKERDEKLEALAAKGIVVQTSEEKERDQMQLDNMLEKARQEADDLAKKEKEDAKREGKEQGGDQLPDSDDEDEEWHESDDNEPAVLSGSEDEDEDGGSDAAAEDEDEDVDGPEVSDNDGLIDNQAEEDVDEADDERDDDSNNGDGGDEDNLEISRPTGRQSRKTVVISDDEDEGSHEDNVVEHETPALPTSDTAAAFGFHQKPKSPIGLSQVFAATMADSQTQEDMNIPQATVVHPISHNPNPETPARAAFGFGNRNAKPFGLSQVFQGTMAESPTQGENASRATAHQKDPLAFLRNQTPSKMMDFPSTLMDDSQSLLVEDSQQEITQLQSPVDAQNSAYVQFETQSQATYKETQYPEVPDATQDAGFQNVYSQPQIPASFSTVDTVPLELAVEPELSSVKNKTRLVRGKSEREPSQSDAMQSAESDAEHDTVEQEESEARDAFEILRRSYKNPHPPPQAFNKKNSEAKGMIEEQAEESEDEYAGLGGASDDDSDGELDEEAKKLIDDDSKEKVNEREIAAFYADKERAEDEKRMQKLYTDVINGGLRRKRGAADLWESDDEDEAAARRRAAKQRHEAKMRKALLADDKIGKIAENPKQAAFLAAIADREEGEEGNLDFLEFNAEDSVADSQKVLKETTGNATGKRRHSAITDGMSSSNEENRPPTKLRRGLDGTARYTRPTSLADIRNTLSELVGEPESQKQLEDAEEDGDNTDLIVPSSADEEDQGSDIDDEEERVANSQVDEGFTLSRQNPILPSNPRRNNPSAAHATIIDRMALKRAGSSSKAASRENSSGATTSANVNSGKLAFHATSSNAGGSGFKMPSLLRRATTNMSNTSSTSSDSGAAAGGMGKDGVRMGGTAKSSVNYYVREQERKARIEEVEKERVEGRERVGRLRRGQVKGEGGLRRVAGGGVFG